LKKHPLSSSLLPLSKLPKHDLTLDRALLSVSDKTDITPLAQALHQADVEIISTGGTARIIREANISVTDISTVTGFEECLDGRVKTMHKIVNDCLQANTSNMLEVDDLD